jgi:hypothetical protein
MNSARFFLVILALAGTVIPPSSVRAQDRAPLERLEIVLWPEYDEPALLVIYRATLPEATALPASVMLPIPASVGEPTAVAYANEQGQLLLAPYVRTADGEWATLSIEAPTRHIQVEYYLDMTTGRPLREFTFRWAGGVVADDAGYEVQQPAASGDLTIDPPPSTTRIGADGLRIHSGRLGALTAESAFEIRVSYTRETGALSSELVGATPPLTQPAVTQDVNPPGQAILPWVLLGLGITVPVVGVVIALRAARGRRTATRRIRHRTADAGPATYCHSCGARASAGDTYCRRCGAQLHG